MRLLVDTHVFLWALSNDRRLTPALRNAVETATGPLLSAVSICEIENRIALGKLSMQGDPAALARRMGYPELALRWSHAREAARLPLLHRDPYDRILIAQAHRGAWCSPRRTATSAATTWRFFSSYENASGIDAFFRAT